MPEAPLQVVVELALESGPAAGERRYRLSRSIGLPPRLRFDRALPVEGEARARLRFGLPTGERLELRALVHHDPDHPERGSDAELVDLRPETIQTILRYIEERTTP